MNPSLETIFLSRGCTKARYHSYSVVYEEFFAPIREDVQHVLELGVLNGASLFSWCDYFPNATLHGIDCDPAYLASFKPTDRMHLYQSDTRDRAGFTKLCDSLPDLDIIIDDAGHVPTEQVWACCTLWSRLSVGGFYAIEDCYDRRTLKLFGAFHGSHLFDLTPNNLSADDFLAILTKGQESVIETRALPTL